MADMLFVVRRETAKVRFWDYDSRKWVAWKLGEKYSPVGMAGSYHLATHTKKLVLQRISRAGIFQWEEILPEGVAAYHGTRGGGKVVLPWEETNQHLLVCRLLGLQPEQVHFQSENVTMVTLSPREGIYPDKRPYLETFETDGSQKITEQGVQIVSPSYVVQMEVSPPAEPGRLSRKLATVVMVWPQKLAGDGISPRQLATVLHKLNLRNTMKSWEKALYDEHLAKKKAKQAKNSDN